MANANLFRNEHGDRELFHVHPDLPRNIRDKLVALVELHGGNVLEYVPKRGYVLADLTTQSGEDMRARRHDPANGCFVLQYEWAYLSARAGKKIPRRLRYHPLFVKGNRPMRIYVHDASFEGDAARTLRRRIEERGGVCQDVTEADVNVDVAIIGDDGHHAYRALKRRFGTVQTPDWVARCIQRRELVLDERAEEELPADREAQDRQLYAGIQDIILGPRRRGAERNGFTAEEDRHLLNYIVENLLGPFGLSGNALYKGIEREPWGARHTWHSWRERYVRHKKRWAPAIKQEARDRCNIMSAQKRNEYLEKISLRRNRIKAARENDEDDELLGDVEEMVSNRGSIARSPSLGHRRPPVRRDQGGIHHRYGEAEEEEEEEGEEDAAPARGDDGEPSDADAGIVDDYVGEYNAVDWAALQDGPPDVERPLTASPPPMPPPTGTTLVPSQTQVHVPSPSPPPTRARAAASPRVTRARSRQPMPAPPPARRRTPVPAPAPSRRDSLADVERQLRAVVDESEKDRSEDETAARNRPRTSSKRQRVDSDDEDTRLLLVHQTEKNKTAPLTPAVNVPGPSKPSKKTRAATQTQTFTPKILRRNRVIQPPEDSTTSSNENENAEGGVPLPHTRADSLRKSMTMFKPLPGTRAAQVRASRRG
ncbi:hypothetical protein EXIGLDRAFT_718544 [Exidia glandulosa HHB12029]|uniref:DNA-binding protein RAP1 n=1 Tax=Exidia glandulosa HHB12029 TaxID=1314781 RepID=A0A165HP35_EXIGL|nr:hypothetical protein EXIGLDRAFT_718544 [Exidia glandulosa HHB12029]